MAAAPIFRLHLLETSLCLTMDGLNNDKTYLEINRLGGEVVEYESSKRPLDSTQVKETIELSGVIAILKLWSGYFLIGVTGVSLVGTLKGAHVWKITKTRVISFSPSLALTLNPLEKENEVKVLKMLQLILPPTDGNYYFSRAHDLTRSCQLAYESKIIQPSWQSLSGDSPFFFNQFVQKSLLKLRSDKWIFPIIQGYVFINNVMLENNSAITYALISRRSYLRTGTRLNKRGIDDQGNVANFVETEQIIIYNKQLRSLVQVRGSIPLFWSQDPKLALKPKPVVNKDMIDRLKNSDEVLPAFKEHYDSLNKQYGCVCNVDLVDQKGAEGQLQTIFASQCELLQKKNATFDNIEYHAFDFHKECSKMRWHRVKIVLDKISSRLQTNGYYSITFQDDGSSITNSLQKGVVRTNCIDCLDRTNVVQSMIGRFVLLEQLKDLNLMKNSSKPTFWNSSVKDIIAPNASKEIYDEITSELKLLEVFRNVWANNADAISMDYAATGALKTDFTRTGSRTAMGAVNDLINSVKRIYFNNFTDGDKQDALEIFTGKFIPYQSGIPAPFNKKALGIKAQLLYATLFLCCIMILMAGGHGKTMSYEMLSWCFFLVATIKFIMSNGRDFVNKPCLSRGL